MEAAELFSANGIVAVVTGGGTGIGLMAAVALEANGAERVYIVGRRQKVLENAAKQAKFGNIVPLVGDITSKTVLQSIAEKVSSESGRVDVLVNNAGVMTVKHKSLPLDSLHELQEELWKEDPDKWAEQFQVNVTGAFFTTVAFLKLLKAGNDHWISNKKEDDPVPTRTSLVISTAGIAGHHRGMARFVGYAASKAGLLHLTKSLSTILAAHDIRFNILSPGLFPTEITEGGGHLDDHNRNHLGKVPRSEVPEGRAGDELDIAGAILFLCGRSGWYCNGVEVITDGGRLAISPSTY